MLRKVEAALSMAEASGTAVDSVESVRGELIRWRDKALAPDTFNSEAAVLLSHVIAHLTRLMAVEEAMRKKETR